ncbi:cytochrome c oxidase subunit VIIa [Aspergillus tanneri]|uniref:Uncharacterized protein n=1 Tax=Aspergillus tanneri TaxID=1220188 RepID=A0A5M9MM97_9EURO|nr:uncharacterized protein ATNIH1004_007977 [Aspergillus tanneri]KAA8646544.1 hypothetical protein ATNIH1004_007977 [Aspergillus tanneri]
MAAIAPITGMLRRSLVLDLSTAFGESLPMTISGSHPKSGQSKNFSGTPVLGNDISIVNQSLQLRISNDTFSTFHYIKRLTEPCLYLGFGTTFGYLWWYGYHLPRVRARDNYYTRLEQERAAQQA